MGFLSGVGNIAGPLLTIAGVATGNPALAMAGIGTSVASAAMGQTEANQQNVDMQNTTNNLNVQEAQKNRDFQAQQAQKTTDFNAAQNDKVLAYNADQARINREFQASQSSTSYQRAVADMQAAGLNPMLAVSQGGASTPSGATATGSAATGVSASGAQASLTAPKVQNVNSQTMSTALQGAQTMLAAQNSAADIQLKNSQSNQSAAQTEQALTQSVANKAQAAKTLSETYKPNQFGQLVDTQMAQNRANAQLQGNTAKNVKDLVAPTSDPWYLRNLKSVHNSALDVYKKSAGTNGRTYQLFSTPLGK